MMIWCSAGVIILRCWICEERKCGCKWWCGLRWWEWFVFEWFLDCCCGRREPWLEWCDLGELLIFVGDKNVEANVEFVKWDEVEYIGVGWDVMWLIILCNSPSDEWCVNDGEGGLSWELISGIVEIFIEEFSFSFWWADVEFVIWVLRSVMFDVSSVGVYSYMLIALVETKVKRDQNISPQVTENTDMDNKSSYISPLFMYVQI